jgi:hypothetical protein
MAEIFDFPLGKAHPLQQAHDRFAEAIAADPDSIWDEIPRFLEEIFAPQIGATVARKAAAAAAERTRIDCMQRVLGGEPLDEVRPKAMAIAIAAMAEELKGSGYKIE